MAAPLTPAERRVARFLFVVAVIGTLWHLIEGLRPPPPPLEIVRGAFGPDSSADAALHDSTHPFVLNEMSSAFPIDLRTAGAQALTALPGIGPVLAGRIVAWRTSRTDVWQLTDLLEVRGIGPATIERIRPLVTMPETAVQAPTETAGKGDPGGGGDGAGKRGKWR